MALASFLARVSAEGAQPSVSGANPHQLGVADYAVTQIAGVVFATSTPLTADQRVQLVPLIAQNSPNYTGGEEATLDTIDWKSVIAQAGPVLSPVQIAAINSLNANAQQWALEKQIKAAAAATRFP